MFDLFTTTTTARVEQLTEENASSRIKKLINDINCTMDKEYIGIDESNLMIQHSDEDKSSLLSWILSKLIGTNSGSISSSNSNSNSSGRVKLNQLNNFPRIVKFIPIGLVDNDAGKCMMQR